VESDDGPRGPNRPQPRSVESNHSDGGFLKTGRGRKTHVRHSDERLSESNKSKLGCKTFLPAARKPAIGFNRGKLGKPP
jgi:hypothetical protein